MGVVHSASLPAGERGFVLITAMWLLILCGSLASLLVLQGIRAREAVSDQEGALRARLAQDSAFEIVTFDLLTKGGASRFAQLPSTNTIDVDGASVLVRMSSEAGRLDLNDGDMSLIAAALEGSHVQQRAQKDFLSRLEARRAAGSRLDWSEANQLIRALDGTCLAELFTVGSGLTNPDKNQMRSRLAASLGDRQHRPVASPEFGSEMRIELSSSGAPPRLVTLRMSGDLAAPLAITQWRYNDINC